MTTRSMAAVPFKPLELIARTMADTPIVGDNQLADEDLGQMLGVSDRSVFRWRTENSIPWKSADQCAINLGLHPLLVWGDEWIAIDHSFIYEPTKKQESEYRTACRQIDGMLFFSNPDAVRSLGTLFAAMLSQPLPCPKVYQEEPADVRECVAA